MSTSEKTKIELLKEESRGLRGPLLEEVQSETSKFSPPAENILKFHGIYQQKNRDRKKPTESPETYRTYGMMVRGRIPGGRLNWDQWLAWDSIADAYAVNGLRLTTRQSLQIHGVLKQDLKSTIASIHNALSSTTGACGDVVRNVTQAVNPRGEPRLAQLDQVADLLSRHFEVGSNAYFEIFLDGQPLVEEREDPIYGRAYLPRKFKIGLTVEGNNSIDIYTHDLGLVASFDRFDQLDGYHVLVGGGMGMSHSEQESHPRLADLLGWVPASALLPMAEAVVTTQRDYGNRENRSFARLKYLIEARGLDWFRGEVEKRAEQSFESRPLPPWRTPNYLGWSEHSDGSLSLGFHTLSGRIVDSPKRPLKSALRDLIAQYRLDLQITPEQDLILYGIPKTEQRAIEAFLDSRGLSPASPERLYDRALTCVALPTCSKALAEAERVGPEVFGWIQESLHRLKLNELAPIVRITGCPNGCARPYTAELGIVGQMPGHYAIYLGGDVEGLRLGQKIRDKVKFLDLPAFFDRLLDLWSREKEDGERLGDFAWRFGHKALEAQL